MSFESWGTSMGVHSETDRSVSIHFPETGPPVPQSNTYEQLPSGSQCPVQLQVRVELGLSLQAVPAVQKAQPMEHQVGWEFHQGKLEVKDAVSGAPGSAGFPEPQP